MSRLQYLTSLKGPVMASCISRFKSEDFKKYITLSGYLAGRKVEFEVPDPIEIQTDIKSDTAPDFMAVEGVSIVSEKMKSLIEQFEVPNVEFFRASVELFDEKTSLSRPTIYLHAYPPGDVGGGNILENYWWMNIWNRVDVIDRDRSIGAWMPGLDAITVRSFPNEDIPDYFLPEDGRQSIVLKRGLREHLFRVVGLRGTIFVSPEFSEAMEQTGIEVAVSDFAMRRGAE